jgi:anti-sigma factor RsiW
VWHDTRSSPITTGAWTLSSNENIPDDHAPQHLSKRLTCRDCAEFLGEYIDGALPVFQQIELERHLRLCPPCVTFIEQYKKTIELSRESLCTESATMPAHECPEALIQAILAARAKHA